MKSYRSLQRPSLSGLEHSSTASGDFIEGKFSASPTRVSIFSNQRLLESTTLRNALSRMPKGNVAPSDAGVPRRSSRKRPCPSEPIVLSIDVPKRPRRTRKNTWKVREAREAKEALVSSDSRRKKLAVRAYWPCSKEDGRMAGMEDIEEVY